MIAAASRPAADGAASQQAVPDIAPAEGCPAAWDRAEQDRYTEPMTATPISWPSWTVVVSRPDASAARAAGTCTRAWVSSGLTEQSQAEAHRGQPGPGQGADTAERRRMPAAMPR